MALHTMPCINYFLSRLVNSVRLREDLAGKIEDWHGVWNADGLADFEEGKVPTAYHGYKSTASGDLEQVEHMCDLCSGSGARDGEVGRSDEGEEQDQADEQDVEDDVDAKGADEEDDGDDAPAITVSNGRRMVGAKAVFTLSRCGRPASCCRQLQKHRPASRRRKGYCGWGLACRLARPSGCHR